MKTRSISMLGSGVSAALLLAGCLQDEPTFVTKDTEECSAPIEPPSLYLNLYDAAGDYGCAVLSMNTTVDCESPFPASATLELSAEADWYGQPGVIRVSNTCGGSFIDVVEGPFTINGTWQVPSAGSECTVILKALDLEENVLASVDMTFDIGTLPARPNIQASVVFEHQNGICHLLPGEFEVACDHPVLASDRPIVRVAVDWDFATPGIIEWGGDICGGEFIEIFNDGSIAEAEWLPPDPAWECTESLVLVYTGSADPLQDEYFELTVPLLLGNALSSARNRFMHQGRSRPMSNYNETHALAQAASLISTC